MACGTRKCPHSPNGSSPLLSEDRLWLMISIPYYRYAVYGVSLLSNKVLDGMMHISIYKQNKQTKNKQQGYKYFTFYSPVESYFCFKPRCCFIVPSPPFSESSFPIQPKSRTL